MNCDIESVDTYYPKMHMKLIHYGMEIPPWLDQYLDLVYGYLRGNLSFLIFLIVFSLLHS